MELSQIFSNNLVFAKDKPVRIFGSGKGNGEITFMGETKRVASNSDFWCVEFSPRGYGGPYEIISTLNGETTIIKNVYVGEVLVFCGQSNLQFKLASSKTPKSLYETNSLLRLFSTKRLDDEEFFYPEDGWVTAKKDEVYKWTALGYLASNLFQNERGVAVGVITCYQGASVIESWLPRGELEKNGIVLLGKEKFIDHFVPQYTWNKDGFLYDFALSQILPFSVSAVVWYQGESDAYGEEAKMYDRELEILISCYRKAFNDENLPFAIVGLADCDERAGEGWTNIQNAQEKVAKKDRNSVFIVSKDVCETNDIHPPTKHFLAKRICEGLKKII